MLWHFMLVTPVYSSYISTESCSYSFFPLFKMKKNGKERNVFSVYHFCSNLYLEMQCFCKSAESYHSRIDHTTGHN